MIRYEIPSNRDEWNITLNQSFTPQRLESDHLAFMNRAVKMAIATMPSQATIIRKAVING